jgi:glycosyltransferase involved in cell wall biosynthesis
LACEISARDTFRASRDRNLLRVLDAPSLHPAAQDRLHGTADSPRLHRAIRRVKDEEIALADRILTVSQLARDTYLEAGIPSEKVHAVPLGADLELFRPPAGGRSPCAERPVRFLFAGATIERKGFDLLLAALDRVAERGGRFELRLVGPSSDDRWRRRAWASSAGSVDQAGLAEEMRRADLLVLPSRNDSYGMVVAEALATGLPALVSTMVGAKDLIEEGVSGWVVPVEDVEALAARLLESSQQPDVLSGMGEAARRSAESATWDGYSTRLVAWFRDLLAA